MEVSPGFKQTEVGVIPEEWEVKALGELGEALIGLTYKPSDVREVGTLVLRSSNIQNDALAFDDNVFVDTDIPERIRARPGDVLVCVRNGSRNLIGKAALLDERAVGMTFGAFMAVYRSPIGKLASYLFQSEVLKRQINEHLGATINQITNKSLNSFRIPVSPLDDERGAIATALSDVDALLRGLDRLIAKKRDLKQAAMQQLLTGQARLPGFHGEWEVKPLGSVCNPKKGELIAEESATPGEFPVVAGGRGPSYFHNRPNRWGKTITVSGSGAYAGFVSLFDVPIFASDCSTISESPSYSIEFLYHQLVLRQGVIYRLQTGGAQPHVHPTDIAPLLLHIPDDVSEQAAIASVLKDMDAELAALEARRDKTRDLKQAMMQELLTGKTRLVPEGAALA